jgi:heme/copper-type cytochrome/quinol oxidase subunit 4
MSDTAISENAHDTAHDHDAHDHPQEKQYWVIFAILAVLTAVEVAWSYLGLTGPALVLPLIVMMLAKFFLVAGVFMHLYFDLKMLNGKYFTWAFAGAVVLAVIVYLVVFATFHFRFAYFG